MPLNEREVQMVSKRTQILFQELKYIYGFQFRNADMLPVSEDNQKKRTAKDGHRYTQILLQELKYIYGFQFRYLDTPPVWDRNQKRRISKHAQNTGRDQIVADRSQRRRG